MAEESKSCFVIAPIGAEGSPERKRSDQILKHLIRPMASKCGYEAVRSDEISEPGVITRQVIEHVVSDPMVIADLTGWNPNVFYELAIRHATGKPCVQLIQRNDNLPFDVAPQRKIFVDLTDPDNLETARTSLVEQIKAAEAGERSDNPITTAIDLQHLRSSGDPQEEQTAKVLDSIDQLRTLIVRRLPSSPFGISGTSFGSSEFRLDPGGALFLDPSGTIRLYSHSNPLSGAGSIIIGERSGKEEPQRPSEQEDTENQPEEDEE